jgi:PAS domain S-box-containing protein
MSERAPPEGPAPGSAAAVEQSLWELSLDLLATATVDGYLTRVNPAWESTLGYTPDELMARPYMDFVHPDDVAETLAQARALLNPGHATASF